MKTILAEALKEPRAEFDRRYEEHNRAKLAANQQVLELAAIARVPTPQLPPSPAIRQQLAQLRNPTAQWGDGSPEHRHRLDRAPRPVHPAGPDQKSRVFVAQPGPGVTSRQAARTILAEFLPRAFRRPVEDVQVERYLKFFDRAGQDGDSFEAGRQADADGPCSSRPISSTANEFGPVDGEYRLDDYQIASRLSYFLWMSMPDDRASGPGRLGPAARARGARGGGSTACSPTPGPVIHVSLHGAWLGSRGWEKRGARRDAVP